MERYKHTNFNIRWLNNGFKIIDGIIRLSVLSVPKQQKKYLKEKYDINVDYLYITIPDEYKNIGGNPKVIEIIPVPKTKRYKVNIIIELPPAKYKEDNEIYKSIDLGINNLMTCYITTGKTFIISGRQLLSINRYYDNAKVAHAKSIVFQPNVSDI